MLSARLQGDLLDEREEGESEAGHRVEVFGVRALGFGADLVADDLVVAGRLTSVISMQASIPLALISLCDL